MGTQASEPVTARFRLTDKAVAKIGPEVKVHWDSEMRKLGVKVFPSGLKSWIFEYRWHGERRRITLGDTAQVDEKAARRELALFLRSPSGSHMAIEWRDGKRRKVEEVLNDFMITVVRCAEDEKEAERDRKQRERESHERSIREYEQRRRLDHEIERFKQLKEDAGSWETSQRLKAFLADIRQRAETDGPISPDSKLALWLAWAEGRANHMDPSKEILANPPEPGDLTIR